MIKSIKKILEPVVGYSMVVIILLAIISIIAIFCGAIMRIFGFEYDSIRSIILFFILVAVTGFPTETLALALPRALLSVEKITIRAAKILFVILDVLSTIITMTVIDYFMESVSASGVAIFVIAILIAIGSMKDVDKYSEA